RAVTCIVNGESSPAILYMFGIIRSRPCEAVNVVESAPACNAPWTAPAAPPSDCISAISGMTPQRFVFPRLAHSSQTSAIGELGVIGKIAIASLKRKATEAAASLPSTVILLLLIVSHKKAQNAQNVYNVLLRAWATRVATAQLAMRERTLSARLVRITGTFAP